MTRIGATFGDLPDMPLLTVQEERAVDVRLYRPHTPQVRRSGIDWAATTPTCSACGTRSSRLNRDDQCPSCVAPTAPQAETTPPTPRRPRQSTPRSTGPRRAPGRPRLPLDTDAIVEAYTGGQSIPDICTALGVDRARVREAILDAHIPLRDDRGRHYSSSHAPINVATLIVEYEEGASAPQIADRYGVTPQRIRKLLDQSGVQRRDDRALHSGGRPRTYDAQTCTEISRLYLEGKLSITQVAGALSIPYKTVVTIMRRNGIPARQRQAGGVDGAADLKAQMTRLGVTSRHVKEWAKAQGLIDTIARGIPAQRVVDAYEAAHAEQRVS